MRWKRLKMNLTRPLRLSPTNSENVRCKISAIASVSLSTLIDQRICSPTLLLLGVQNLAKLFRTRAGSRSRYLVAALVRHEIPFLLRLFCPFLGDRLNIVQYFCESDVLAEKYIVVY